MAGWFGPGSGTAPGGWQPPSRPSTFIRPNETAQRGARVANIPGLGQFQLGGPDDPLTQMVGRLPGEAPQEWQAQQFLQGLGVGQQGGQQAPAGMDSNYFSVHNPNSSIYRGGASGGSGSAGGSPYAGGPGSAYAGGGGGAQIADPSQLNLPPNPTQAQAQGALDRARSMAFGELERPNALYEGQLGQGLEQGIQGQMSGADQPFSDQRVQTMQNRLADQAGAADRSRQAQIRESFGSRGLGGSGMQQRAALDSMDSAARQRGQGLGDLLMAQQRENFASRERARGQAQSYLGQRAGTLAGAAGRKADLLSRFEVMGDETAGALGQLAQAIGGGGGGSAFPYGGAQAISASSQGGSMGGLNYNQPSQIGGGLQGSQTIGQRGGVLGVNTSTPTINSGSGWTYANPAYTGGQQANQQTTTPRDSIEAQINSQIAAMLAATNYGSGRRRG